MRLTHINLVARNADVLAAFYMKVFKCTYLRDPRILSGEIISKGNSLPNSQIYSIWLKLPDCDTPFLEIHEHSFTKERELPAVNEPGFGHLSFQTEDLRSVLADIIDAGGAQVGEVVNLGSEHRPHLITYTRDPEGNIVEVEQPFLQAGSS